MFEYEYANSKRDQQLKLSLTSEEIAVIDNQVAERGFAGRQDFVKFCISQEVPSQNG